MSNPNLELAFKQFHSIVETIDAKNVTINIKQLRDAMAQGLDVLADAMREIAEPAQVKRRIMQIAGSENRIYALDESGELWEINQHGAWDNHPPLPDREIKQ